MSAIVSATDARRSRVRLLIVTMLFLVTTVNYADRATLSIAGPALSKELHLDPVAMGYVFSAFGWSYVIAQVPCGWLLDRYGSKWVYAISIIVWSIFTAMQGLVGFLSAGAAVALLFGLRFLVGFAEAPSFPANARIVAAWFPGNERGTASAFFNSGQYFATVIFAPLMGWIAHEYGWRHVFYVMGGLGIVMGIAWIKTIYEPKDHPAINEAEFDYIKQGGALVDMDAAKAGKTHDSGPSWGHIRQLLANRMMLGVYIGQYCINTLTYFFLTWFPVYLVKERGLSILQAGFVATLPALCGFVGGVLGGVISDYLLRRTGSLTMARKIPIVGGMLLSMVIVACNYVDSQALVVGFMALAFFGKGIGALGWAVVSDTSPKEAGGVSGGLFNTFGNLSSITTPIIIGYILAATGSFNGALVFVGANALVAAIAYLFIVGEIKRVQLKAA
ncbi:MULTISPECIES: MFS transporter [unclassified Bradyrhizobium]|uniref:MFS transporter n=1 Tax=unclassified Bradyrhizobium TaxID=2631580 RepID=UPI001BAADBAF|nr:MULTISPECIES: MFS transporter [unclassified Bradyrhizobium]MBR1202797.1 MFS transporter [Bradyrhizobium sp. AUGA SZCCT0124]MBR1314211.1 MFS transporter [Bradyrhizobium sp. AUGA SZCCT0051]MBR1342771.1 MFS transporter [Bradyrhizobium sp. AUGA SZCCT0105]MBR1353000.1 MFS transporter [Bradyrhizobium sp. AUGA SZCCT0045]